MHVGEFRGSAGSVTQRTELTARQRQILKALDIPEPQRFAQISTNAGSTS